MRYKIIKKKKRYNERVYDYYYIMKESKKWFSKTPKWKHVW